MANENQKVAITLPAAADLSSYQGCFVTVDSSSNAALASTGGQMAIGVLDNKPDALGRAATVVVGGVVQCLAGATVAAGAKIMTEVTTCRGITATSGNHVLGIALTGAADGEFFSLLLLSKHILA